MRTHLERSDLMRKSIGDIITGYRTGAEIGNIESEIATREAELPYVGRRARAIAEQIEAGIDKTREETADIVATRNSRIRYIDSQIRAIDQEIAESRALTPVQIEELKARRDKLVTERQQIEAEGVKIPVELGGRITEIPARIGFPIIMEQERLRESDRQYRETQSRLRDQFQATQENRQATQDLATQEAIARRERELEKRRSDASEAELGLTGSYYRNRGVSTSDYPALAAEFNRNSDNPYIYVPPVDTNWPFESGRYRRLRLPVITKRSGEKIQLTAEQLYNAWINEKDVTRKGMTFDNYVTRLYKDLGLDVRSYYIE